MAPFSFEESNTTSNGKGAALFVGTNAASSRRRSMILFSLSTVLPLTGQQVINATLRLNVLSPVSEA